MALSLIRPEPGKHANVTPTTGRPKYGTIRAITASATTISTTDKSELQQMTDRRKSSAWQTKAWDYTETIGELRKAGTLVGNILSRIRVYPGYVTDADLAPADIDQMDGIPDSIKADANRVLRHLGSGSGSISSLLRDAGVNLFVTGECYLVRVPKRGTHGQKQWEIRSVDEIIIENAREVYIKSTRNTKKEQYIRLDTAEIGRIWVSNPRYSDEADSAFRPLTELMDELLMWNKAVRIALKSAQNGGILYLPDELDSAGSTFDSESDEDDIDPVDMGVLDDDEDSISEALMESMTAPLRDENAASSIFPLILRGPADAADKIKHILLSRDLPEKFQERADRVLARIINSLDLPPDMLTGVGSLKYTGAQAVSESLFRDYIQPLAVVLMDAFTTVYLRPSLKALGHTDDDIARVTLWYDASEIISIPNRSDSATEGYDKSIISSEAWRRAHGFSASDAPTESELAKRMAMERGLLSEATSEMLIQELLPTLTERMREQSLSTSGLGNLLPQDQGPIAPDGALPGEPELGAPDPFSDTPASDVQIDTPPPATSSPNLIEP